ncbi:2-C-methyl-D-erythritol 4-phosphate cytidylyltransferase [Arsenicibacter rosenii]|uniref:2-C-methyl-D-erythritol 4-phosphate cytidylyltransferase n=1 Tax=Arsenicibacter rosenii TaxID=1750698 RepID=A0A1S2VMU3_9BACT|nr:2-C-methyl-D-erythritol 4-phosphate cytidylyltransferase [Arsenicibacter rosenii]OIN60093.1 2-C-methyl-D-erythritol 4-phosphate cytidylyltransferase [Arsenicibacter rosenii]
MNPQPLATSHQPLFCIIVAGGSGSRMKSDVPKQFLLLNGKPILQHTIERFLAYSPNLRIILVLPARDMNRWTELCDQHNFYPPIQTVIGGASRFQSVRNGLKKISAKEGLVAVHDGVRPMITTDVIGAGFDTAAEQGSAVTCVAVKDSVRVVEPDGTSKAVDRSQYRLMQTPQTFRLSDFRQAFTVEEQPFFTDCASVMEFAGYAITLVEGTYENIKITTPEDLHWAESVLAGRGV